MSKLVHSHWWSIFFVLFFPLLIMYVYSDFIRSSELNSRLGWLILLGGLAYLFRYTWLQKLLLGVIVLFTISGSMDVLYAVTFGGVFVSATFEAIALTNTGETLEFIQAYTNFENVLILILYWTIAFYSIKRILFKQPVLIREKVFAGLGVVMVFVAIQQIDLRGRTFDTIPGFTGIAIDYSSAHKHVDEVVEQRKRLFESRKFTADKLSEKPQTYVIVIGESLNRNHMSLYGYPRATTPYVDKLGSEVVVFDNVISNYAQTAPSLNVALTESDIENGVSPYKAISLIGVFKKAGFKTYWISNQQPLRIPTKPFAAIAEQQKFISHDFHGVEVERYDGYLLPAVKSALKDDVKHKVIFVHMMGSHLQYRNRYPADKEVFSGHEGVQAYREDPSDSELDYINSYDNSVYYTDYVLSQVLTELKDRKGIAGLSFWSDHGEEVFDSKGFKGHGPDGVTTGMLEVPFFFWRNEAYKTEFKEQVKSLSLHTSAPVMLDDFFHIAQCFVPVRSDLFIQSKSLCAKDYDDKARIVYGKNYDKGLK